jgi:membrane protein YqaA with SNARE-associated domain
MNNTAENKTSRWARLRRSLRKREYWISIAGIIVTIGLIVVIILNWGDTQLLGKYGYPVAFLLGVFGGATFITPVPIIFLLGTILKPAFAPYLGPVFVGIAAGLGETIGAVTVYMTGYGGGEALDSTKHATVRAIYMRISDWMERRGSLLLFLFSSIMNPFFYPIAITAGATRFGLKRYLIICIIGKTIKGTTVAAAGYWGLGSILRALGISI